METEGKLCLADVFISITDPRQAGKVEHDLVELVPSYRRYFRPLPRPTARSRMTFMRLPCMRGVEALLGMIFLSRFHISIADVEMTLTRK